MPDNKNLYIGLMSGTSVDSIDAALVEIYNKKIKLHTTHSHTIPEDIKKETLSLSSKTDVNIILTALSYTNVLRVKWK